MDEQLVEKMAEIIENGRALVVDVRGSDPLGVMKPLSSLEVARQLITELGLVQLDEDQSLPKINQYEEKMRSRLTIPSATMIAQQDMLKAGFKRVKCGK